MKGIRIKKPGGSSQMKYEEIPIPEPGKNEVSRLNILADIKMSYCAHPYVRTLYYYRPFKLNLQCMFHQQVSLYFTENRILADRL